MNWVLLGIVAVVMVGVGCLVVDATTELAKAFGKAEAKAPERSPIRR